MIAPAPVRAGVRLALTGVHALEALGRARFAVGREDDHELARRFAHVARDLSTLHGLRAEVAGSLPYGPALIVANHLSYIDPLVLGTLRPCLPIAKAEVAGWPLLGAGARALGVLFVQRDSLASRVRVLRRMSAALAGGVSVLNFPEGTTSDGESVLPFRRGSFGIAARLGVPVVPIALRYDTRDLCWFGDALFLPHYLRTAARVELTAYLSIGAPLVPAQFPDARALSEAAHAAVTRLHSELRA